MNINKLIKQYEEMLQKNKESLQGYEFGYLTSIEYANKQILLAEIRLLKIILKDLEKLEEN